MGSHSLLQEIFPTQRSKLWADDQAAVVFTQGHAVGVLADKDEVRLEGSAKRGTNSSVTYLMG